jgi:hypothetical protein
MNQVIGFLLANFTLTFFVLGLVAAGVSLAMQQRPPAKGKIAETLLAYFVLFSIGLSFLYNFVCHVFFGEMAARFIGWEQSPFQLEVGMASLGFSAVGLLAFRGGRELRLAAIVGPACFLWGAAAGHIYQMIAADNLAPGNAGIMLYSDLLLPVFGLALLWLTRTRGA